MSRYWSRRDFLRSSIASAASIGMPGAFGVLAGAGATAAQAAPLGDYKALVCIMLFGGNDGFNLLVPRVQERYEVYRQARGNLAVPRDQLLPLSSSLLPLLDPILGTSTYGLHPAVPEMQGLFKDRRFTFVANAGPLLAPVTKADVQAGRNLPPRLYSHNDQQDSWMASEPDSLQRRGWAGRLADLFGSANANSRVSMNISLAGNNLLQIGNTTVPYTVTSSGVPKFRAYGGTSNREVLRTAAYRKLVDPQRSSGLFQRYAGDLTTRAIDLGLEVNNALAAATPLTTEFPANNRLADQLKMVAQLISVRRELSMSRQVFVVSIGGFDTHDNQLVDHPRLLAQLSQAMKAFDDATLELGIDHDVTSFTMSDFGRTLTSNGDGTDHAWGNVQAVMGGAVKGGSIHGTFPDLTLNGPDDAAKNGRLIPTTSVEQYGASLLRWFGADSATIDTVFPHLGRFASRDLGFLA